MWRLNPVPWTRRLVTRRRGYTHLHLQATSWCRAQHRQNFATQTCANSTTLAAKPTRPRGHELTRFRRSRACSSPHACTCLKPKPLRDCAANDARNYCCDGRLTQLVMPRALAIMAERRKLPESYRQAARHAPRKATPPHEIWRAPKLPRSRRKVAQKLLRESTVGPSVAGLIVRQANSGQQLNNFSNLVVADRSLATLSEYRPTWARLGPTLANLEQFWQDVAPS